MSIKKIVIHVLKPHTRNSIIYFEDKPMVTSISQQSQHDLQGFRNVVAEMFNKLHEEEICEVIAYSALSNKKVDTIAEIANICPFQFQNNKDNQWYDACSLSEDTCEQIRTVIGLIMWLQNEHFESDNCTHRTCIICNEIQFGKPTGQMIGGFSTDVNKPPHNREMYAWPSSHCLNPDCLSHEIEKMIDINYTIPKEAFEKRSLGGLLRNKTLAKELPASSKTDL